MRYDAFYVYTIGVDGDLVLATPESGAVCQFSSHRFVDFLDYAIGQGIAEGDYPIRNEVTPDRLKEGYRHPLTPQEMMLLYAKIATTK